jgi:hypothetical protein
MGFSNESHLNLRRVKQVQQALDSLYSNLKSSIPELHPLEVATALETVATSIRYQESQKQKKIMADD